ncbi:uncharacterized protein TM35_000065080 [Trypanosoma theileri]|uniref:Uncharacterized protein n=1 Tax=Trypanosoma theileri TaxID=67003 RepID=A0A1X0P4B7_9TRYP|nr:uncharacterized protein TM35_000065080 [Trypanosoma theileri]ORC91503.1 hypothetical protein TM35_000065080 [Trypanosoma theileri]
MILAKKNGAPPKPVEGLSFSFPISLQTDGHGSRHTTIALFSFFGITGQFPNPFNVASTLRCVGAYSFPHCNGSNNDAAILWCDSFGVVCVFHLGCVFLRAGCGARNKIK